MVCHHYAGEIVAVSMGEVVYLAIAGGVVLSVVVAGAWSMWENWNMPCGCEYHVRLRRQRDRLDYERE